MADFETVTARGKDRIKARVRKVVNGRTVKHTKTFNTVTDAKKWAAKLEQQLERQDAGLLSEADRHTVKDALDRYQHGDPKDSNPAPLLLKLAVSTRPDYIRHLDYWRERIGSLKLSQLIPAVLDRERDALTGSGKSEATARRYLATLSSVLTACVKRWHWLTDNPMRQVALPTGEKPDPRFLSADEAQKLLAATKASASPDLHLAVLVSLTTGARQSEVMGLRWERIDLQRGVAVLPTSKNKDGRSLVLVPAAVEELTLRRLQVLRAAKRSDTDELRGLVFPSRDDPEKPVLLRSAWHKALERAGVAGLRWHDQRHSVASFLAARGASLKEIGQVLGHRSQNATQIYAHLTEEHAHQLARDMAAAVLTPPPPKKPRTRRPRKDGGNG